MSGLDVTRGATDGACDLHRAARSVQLELARGESCRVPGRAAEVSLCDVGEHRKRGGCRCHGPVGLNLFLDELNLSPHGHLELEDLGELADGGRLRLVAVPRGGLDDPLIPVGVGVRAVPVDAAAVRDVASHGLAVLALLPDDLPRRALDGRQDLLARALVVTLGGEAGNAGLGQDRVTVAPPAARPDRGDEELLVARHERPGLDAGDAADHLAEGDGDRDVPALHRLGQVGVLVDEVLHRDHRGLGRLLQLLGHLEGVLHVLVDVLGELADGLDDLGVLVGRDHLAERVTLDHHHLEVLGDDEVAVPVSLVLAALEGDDEEGGATHVPERVGAVADPARVALGPTALGQHLGVAALEGDRAAGVLGVAACRIDPEQDALLTGVLRGENDVGEVSLRRVPTEELVADLLALRREAVVDANLFEVAAATGLTQVERRHRHHGTRTRVDDLHGAILRSYPCERSIHGSLGLVTALSVVLFAWK